MIPVSKPYLPEKAKLMQYIDEIYQRSWLTNHGPLVEQLTQRLEAYLGVSNLLLVSNGTSALQVAYRALGLLDGGPAEHVQAITTPFSFIATASSMTSQGIQPDFADIDGDTWCLDPVKVQAAITPQTKAIVPVHVFGNACEVESLELIARRHDVRLIYDAAHAFSVKYRDRSLLSHGDAAILSFHATKVFHCIEGGAVVFKERSHYERARRIINFGLDVDATIVETGFNAKMNEFQAAMGLCVLDEFDVILDQRKTIWNQYLAELDPRLCLQEKNQYSTRNYSYFPVLFSSQAEMTNVKQRLEEESIHPRRYFYPSLDTLDHVASHSEQPVSRDISSRILCMPIYPGLSSEKVCDICNIVNAVICADDQNLGQRNPSQRFLWPLATRHP